jgi:large subunit ribosomal protein L9
MKVVLRADIDTLGNKGDLLEVSDGYARNYLVPRGLAIRATKGVVKQAEAMRRNRAARDARDREAAQAVADHLTDRRIEITARAGAGGRLFGSVTSTDVATAVHTQVGVEIDRSKSSARPRSPFASTPRWRSSSGSRSSPSSSTA